ncbi:uncharacterized protein PFL1_04992 [Pseudozyma flocculosa PF-1]|uniref:Autophagy-related protein n=2 Tax=Pseudozyma flocculosa TaxID=84751 RepID=A0A5C3EXL0_9BASI|nr:uncharacterized protein PFL1_04992 [Pseudozyma flocculosa PF-1]EPQ27454.1 hypothetical protein PFL1_04992 [Pseudozyma flocculosa PF-1]SPO36117.1 related to AUT4 - breakdown of autophagic vesicles inside the vacuole [Pseudozyma flocculosa]
MIDLGSPASETAKDIDDDKAPSRLPREPHNETGALPTLADASTSATYAAALLSTAEDATALESRWTTGRYELWAFYLYYVGNSGLGPFNFAPSQLQNLLSQQSIAAGNGLCGGDGQPECRLRWAGKDRTIEGIVLLSNGIAFAIQAVLFLTIGSFADYGTFRPYILMLSTVVCVGISFGWLGVTDPSQWQIAIAFYMVGIITYQLCLSYWTAAFPGLARNLPEMRNAREGLQATPPTVTADEFASMDMLSRNRISNIAFAVCSAGELVVLAVIQGMLEGIHADRDQASNTSALSAIVAFSAGAWTLCALPWFVLEKRRPGQPLPQDTSYLGAAARQALLAARYLWRLRMTLLYLGFFFLFSDALNTTVTVIGTLQNQVVSFSSTKLNELLIVGIAAQGIGIYAFWLVQKRWKLSTLCLLSWVVFFTVVLQVWGFVGIFTQRFGFHHEYEFWLYQVFYGLVVCPWYAVSQTMISEVTPKGYEFLFFSLFSLAGKTSAFVGPFVSQAIADRTGNASTPFYFLLALTLVSTALLVPLDVRKSRVEQLAFLETEARDKKVAAAAAVVAVDARA